MGVGSDFDGAVEHKVGKPVGRDKALACRGNEEPTTVRRNHDPGRTPIDHHFGQSGTATRIEGDDRAGLERLIGYATRPPLSAGRLQITDDEQLTFRLKTPWSDGTTHLLLSPLELIEKLAAVPQWRLNLI